MSGAARAARRVALLAAVLATPLVGGWTARDGSPATAGSTSTSPSTAAAPAGGGGDEASGHWGKRLLSEQVLPPALMAKIAAFKPSKADPGESAIMNTMSADTVDWVGDTMPASPRGSPYTMVVTLVGTARADGDVATLWQSGWRLDDGSARMAAFAGLSRNGVKAGERVTLTRAALPITVKADREVAPALSLVRAANVDLQEVRVQVWSGLGSPTWQETLLSYRYALVGVVMLVLAMWWLRR